MLRLDFSDGSLSHELMTESAACGRPASGPGGYRDPPGPLRLPGGPPRRAAIRPRAFNFLG